MMVARVFLSLLLLWLSLFLSQPAQAEPTLLPKRLTPAHLNQLYAFDTTPLGERNPVVLVPGRAEEKQPKAWWHKIWDVTRASAIFQKHYKLYVYPYHSWQNIALQGRQLELAVTQDLIPAMRPNSRMVFIGYSLGGNLLQSAIAQPAIAGNIMLQRTAHFMMVAAPLHGTPIFSPTWFRPNIRNKTPLRTLGDRWVFDQYTHDAKNLVGYLGWDYFDHGPAEKTATATPAEFRQKLAVYATYYNNNPFKSPRFAGDYLAQPLKLPMYILGYAIPSYGYTVHSVLDYMNRQVGRLKVPCFKPNSCSPTARPFALNDGVVPLISALYLPQKADQSPYQGDLSEILAHLNVGQARIFDHLDHVDMGEYRAIRSRLQAQDILAPQLGKRSPNQWLLYDLEHWAQEL